METSNQTTAMTVRLKLDTLLQLQKVAEEEERTVASLVRLAIKELLERKELGGVTRERMCESCCEEITAMDKSTYIIQGHERLYYHLDCVGGVEGWNEFVISIGERKRSEGKTGLEKGGK